MRILIVSHVFLPSFGGLEKMMHCLAEEFTRKGHDVTVATRTPGPAVSPSGYQILRRPGLDAFVRAAWRADVCLEANISLKSTPLLLAMGRDVVISHQTGYDAQKSLDVRPRLKQLLCRTTTNIYCSKALQDKTAAEGQVIPNAFSAANFTRQPDIPRSRDIAFLGRLVSDKGCDVLLEALHILRDRGLRPGLTIIGEGPERERLAALASASGLDEQVTFSGKLEWEPLAALLQTHEILAIPSSWEEPFGIVALEGAACGCVLIGTAGGGLPEAIGPCGLVVPRRDASSLADGLQRLLADQALREGFRSAAPHHLARHLPDKIATEYEAVIHAAMRASRTAS